MPILFIPNDDNSISAQDISEIFDLLYAQLELAQKRWKSLLETDTFKIASGALPVYHEGNASQFEMKGGKPSSPDFMLKDIFRLAA